MQTKPYANENFRSDVTVALVNHMGGDISIVDAARASVNDFQNMGDTELTPKQEGLVGYLMREKHGSPFEHTAMTFYIEAPIMVFREIHRHRMASYNEMSGRYSELPGDFYIPGEDRNLVNIGSSAKPEMAPGSLTQYRVMHDLHQRAYKVAWMAYNEMLEAGIANEVARNVLPVGLYSKMYMTFNLRSAFNFLSLRVQDAEAVHLSRPQKEIQMVAEEIEDSLMELYPVAHGHFIKRGRVAP